MPAAVVRHHDGPGAAIDAALRVVAAQHALDHDRHGAALHQPFEVGEIGREHHHALALGIVGGARDRLADHVDAADVFGGDDRRPIGARAPARHRLVGGQHQRLEAGLHATVEQRAGRLAVRLHVELEPLRRAAALLRHVLDQGRAAGGHHVKRAGRGRAARGGKFALGMEQMMPPGRRHHDRRVDLVAEQRHAGVDLDDVAQHARPELQPPPRRDVLLGGDLVVGAGVAEHPRLRPHHAARLLLQRIEIDAIHQHFPALLSPGITPDH